MDIASLCQYLTHGNLVPRLDKTSVVSPLYPGQFNYCLDERHWLEKYGDIVNVDEDHFQKIQPAIRLADFDRYYCGQEKSDHHLASFTIGTVAGGHIVPLNWGEHYYRLAVSSILLLLEIVGLDKNRLRFSYFAGGVTGSDVESSRKTNGQMRKIMTQEIIPEDTLSKEVLLNNGIKPDQLIAGDTWTNYLAINWYACVAPWGYRNEIFYQLDDGSLLDISTIEHLDTEPITEGEKLDKVIVGTRPWRKHLVIDGIGLERIVLATRGYGSIMEAMGWNDLLGDFEPKEIEAARVLHRIFTDSSWDELKGSSHSRRSKTTHLMGLLGRLSQAEIETILRRNFVIYWEVFSDLEEGIGKTLAEIAAYRRRRKLSS